jgi:hypothetical protein
MKTLDDAVIELNGVLPSNNENGWCLYSSGTLTHKDYPVWFKRDEFQQRARELGFISGYRWGVEYQTNGKRPDLADDVVVQAKINDVWCSGEDCAAMWTWRFVQSFRITDQRHKPQDTSYLDKPTVIGIDMASGKDQSVGHVAAQDDSDWWDWQNDKMLRFPPTGSKFESYWPKDTKPKWSKGFVAYLSNEHVILKFDEGDENHYHPSDIEEREAIIRPLDHATRKAELEKKRVVDAVVSAWSNIPDMTDFKECLSKLYDLGHLRLPPEKN